MSVMIVFNELHSCSVNKFDVIVVNATLQKIQEWWMVDQWDVGGGRGVGGGLCHQLTVITP